MRKRIIAIVLTAILAVVMCSCSAGKKSSQSSPESAELTVSAMPEFSTYDLDGNAVTESIFAESDITIVNFWGTYCGPCINEMPDLAEWAEELPDNVRLIGIVIDVYDANSETFELARELTEKTGVKYTNLILTDDFNEILSGMVGVPTTIFVDSEGNIVGDQILGAYFSEYKKSLEKLL